MTDIQEALRQTVEGEDFDSPENLLATLSAGDACTKLDILPYSIATNVAHTDIWNRVWVARLTGEPKVNPFPDFPTVSTDQWSETVRSFLATLERADEIANREPFDHHCPSDEGACKLLLQVAIHTAYHLGQIKLLKRALGMAKGLEKG